MRKRMGKRQRAETKRNAFQAERASIIARNLGAPKPPRKVAEGPQGFRSSTAAIDNLKGRSCNVGFVGPRGFHTPKDTLSRAELAGGLSAARVRTQAEREEAQSMANEVKGW